MNDSLPDNSASARIPRLLLDEPFPPYSYVTGKFPHPTRDPAGHSYGVVHPPVAAPDPISWRNCRSYLFGLDLFNHGYYWEAHEAWESLWHAAGRTGPIATFMQALIKLAAAGVKKREGRPTGVRRHALRAAELFEQLSRDLPPGQSSYFGLSLPRLITFATDLISPISSIDPFPCRAAPAAPVEQVERVEIVFSFLLHPE